MRRKLTNLLGGLLLVGVALLIVFLAFVCAIVDVGPDECLVLIAKTGAPLPPGQQIADHPGQRGIQQEALGPGRYFLIRWLWDWEKHPLTVISAGDPATWKVVYDAGQADYATPRLDGQWPEVGLVTSFVGQPWTGATEVVDEGFRGLQRRVLTPGTYRINPRANEVQRLPAVVVPVGCVGVVTSQLGVDPGTESIRETSIGPTGEVIEGPARIVQRLADEGQRGVLKNVLPPGLYYINPKVYQVKLVQIGYNQISEFRTSGDREEISFPSSDGFTISVDITVVWGRDPRFTPEMITRLGEVDKIREIILSQIRSICRNIGSQYVSTDFIEGEKREQYQHDVTETLRRVCRERNIEILIALVQNIEVRGGSSDAEGFDLRQTIQRGYIAQEENLTKQKQQETAAVKAALEAARAAIEVARENISADTRKKVAEIRAAGEKTAEETDALRDLQVAQLDRQVAEIDAERILLLGRATTDVELLKRQAEADGKRMFIEAFGTGRAYNLYTFAQGFDPESVRLIFAGEGTFWTDLTRLQDAAALELLRSQQANRPAPPAVDD
jgi:hypothetical protein